MNLPEYKVGICQNCGEELTKELNMQGKLFCGEKCKQTAALVRYGRSARSDGRLHDPDVRTAINIKLNMVMHGGYPESERRLTPKQREDIFTRDGGLCRVCGAPATSIDHDTMPNGVYRGGFEERGL